MDRLSRLRNALASFRVKRRPQALRPEPIGDVFERRVDARLPIAE
jgi:hypothetical protein